MPTCSGPDFRYGRALRSRPVPERPQPLPGRAVRSLGSGFRMPLAGHVRLKGGQQLGHDPGAIIVGETKRFPEEAIDGIIRRSVLAQLPRCGERNAEIPRS
jgi:hypothetical protein